MLKNRDLREMTRDELLLKKNDLLDERFNLHMGRSLKALDNPLRLRQIRREIALVMTTLHEDTLGIKKLAENASAILPDSKAAKKGKEE